MKFDEQQLRQIIERMRSQRAINCCGMRIVLLVDSSLPPDTIKLIAGPRPDQQVTVTGLDL